MRTPLGLHLLPIRRRAMQRILEVAAARDAPRDGG
jgi:hypothetical protein